MYWMSMEALPRSVLTKIRKLIFDFLWNGHPERQRFHLFSWELLSRPKRNGGWGIRNLKLFNMALNSVTLWHVLTQESLWHSVIRDKYLQNTSIINWLTRPNHKYNSTSRVWVSLLHSLPIILHWITWCPGTGNQIKIGCDRILGMGIRSILSTELLTTLNSKHVTFLSQASKAQEHYNSTERWRSSDELGLMDAQATKWSNYIKYLCGEGITLFANTKDELKWAGGDRSGEFIVLNCYNVILST